MSDIPHPAETADLLPRGFAPAVRERHFARIAVEGPKGAGKTRLMLQWAKAIAGDNPVAVFDTEHRRAAGFAPAPGQSANDNLLEPPWDFWHQNWTGAYDPVVLVRKAEAAAEAVGEGGVICIDSLTPFWSGRGGVQDIVDASPSGWKVGAPVHRDMLDALSRLPCHLIVTMRSKTEWVIEEKDVGGRLMHAARRIGAAPDQRLGIDFEFEVILTVDADHRMTSTASSCPPEFTLVGCDPAQTGLVAQAYYMWITGGVERISRRQMNALFAEFDRVDESAERSRLKNEFLAEFGPPEDILAADARDAIEWVTKQVDAWLAPPPLEPPEAQPAPSEPDVIEQPTLPENADDTGDLLATKSKDELVNLCRGMGIHFDGRWGPARLVEEIRKTMTRDPDAPEPDDDEEVVSPSDEANATHSTDTVAGEGRVEVEAPVAGPDETPQATQA